MVDHTQNSVRDQQDGGITGTLTLSRAEAPLIAKSRGARSNAPTGHQLLAQELMLLNGFSRATAEDIVAHHEVRLDDHNGLGVTALDARGYPFEVVLRRFTTALSGDIEQSTPPWRLDLRRARALAEDLDVATRVVIEAERSSPPEHAQDGMLHFAELEPIWLMDGRVERSMSVQGRVFFGSRAHESRVAL
jgi:hypothetical protein